MGTLRAALQADGGDIQLIDVTDDGIVKVKFLGACCGCPSASMTLKFYIEKELKAKLDSVKEVIMV